MTEPTIYDNERRFIFNNWTNEDFTGLFGNIATLVKSGTTAEFPMFQAYLFTKHLVNREMSRDGKDLSINSDEARAPYEAKTIAEITAGTDSPALASLKEKIKEEIEAESGKKKTKTSKEVVVEENSDEAFADIKK